MGEPGSDLERAIRVSHQPRSGTEFGLAWFILSVGQDRIVSHDGGTGGYRSVIGFDPVRRVGVVVLTNSATDASDIGLHLISRAIPLTPRPIARTAIDVPAEKLARYVGEYEFLRDFTHKATLRVTLENGGLTVQATGRDKAPIFAESETRFFARTADAQFTFLTDAAGLASGLILHQSRFSRTVKKVR
jgi:D-alanyl-D-alanine-carboxypeptidase/D-alanyl-D-alanine-endopeptidase